MRFQYMVVGLLLGAAGCGSSNIAPVSGKVTLDGKPLANATVIFEPISSEKNPGPGSTAKTDENGQYTMQLMTGRANGALVGKHKVMITAYPGGGDAPSSGANMIAQKCLVPDRYN